MDAKTGEFLISLFLLAGVVINLLGAQEFFLKPEKAAKKLGLALSERESSQAQATMLLMQLTGVCLVALAIFYFVTALGPLAQAWSVVAAVLARLTGVIFYARSLAKNGGPVAFKNYLLFNLGLALVPAVLLGICPGGPEALQNAWHNFYWVKSFVSQ